MALVHEPGVGEQQFVERFGEAAHCVVRDERAAMQVSALGGGQRFVPWDLPESIRAQTAEGSLRVERFAGRTETHQQSLQGTFDVSVAGQAIPSPSHSSECEQEQQGFVGRALPMAPPEIEPVEGPKEFVAFHVDEDTAQAAREFRTSRFGFEPALFTQHTPSKRNLLGAKSALSRSPFIGSGGSRIV